MPKKRPNTRDITAEATGEGTRRIVLRPPTASSPGYLRRTMAMMDSQERIKDGEWRAMYDLIDLVAPFVVEPDDADAKRDVLLDASEAQWDALVQAIAGASSKNSSVPESEPPSETGTSE